MEIMIRRAEGKDAKAVAAIAAENWKPIYDGYRQALGEELYSLVYAVPPLELKEASVSAAVEEGRAFVAVCGDTVCGFATFRVEGRLGVLSENAVLGSFRGKGIAKQLYNRVFDELRAGGCQAVSVTTGLDEAHAPARRAYEKAGFEASLPSIRYFQKL